MTATDPETRPAPRPVAAQHGQGRGHVTTRQNVEVHSVELPDVALPAQPAHPEPGPQVQDRGVRLRRRLRARGDPGRRGGGGRARGAARFRLLIGGGRARHLARRRRPGPGRRTDRRRRPGTVDGPGPRRPLPGRPRPQRVRGLTGRAQPVTGCATSAGRTSAESSTSRRAGSAREPQHIEQMLLCRCAATLTLRRRAGS